MTPKQITGNVSSEAPASAAYWQSLSGFTYEQMIREREAKGNKNYQRQEAFLSSFISSEQRRCGHPMEILEFGCGFGRHARYLSDLDLVHYHGYDFSEQMIAPLIQDPPQSLKPVEERLFTGATVLEAVGSRRFDLVFTVSVLIHNPPDRITPLLRMMTEVLKPGGVICLIENKLVPFSVYENDWHQGCWLHCYPEAIEGDWDVWIGQRQIPLHDIYIFRHNDQGTKRLFELTSSIGEEHTLTPITEQEVRALGLAKLKAWAQSVSNPELVRTGSNEIRITELEEQIRVTSELAAKRVRLLSLTEDLIGLRTALVEPANSRTHVETKPANKIDSAVVINDPLDVRWADKDQRFTSVVHVFHQEWNGLRAAAGYLPGRKLAITANRQLLPEEHRKALKCCSEGGVSRVVIHGFSNNAEELIRLLKRVIGPPLRLYVVIQGTTAQFRHTFDMQMTEKAVQLRKSGVLDGLASAKPGMNLLAPEFSPITMLNVPPSGSVPSSSVSALKHTAVIPVPNDWRKNFYTNLYALVGLESIRTILVSAEFKRAPEFERGIRIVRLFSPTRDELFRHVQQADMVMNVTLSECQPLVALESLALGVPCLTGPLGLGELDQHPYQQLAQVCGVDLLGNVRLSAERMLSLRERSWTELNTMMTDYSRQLRTEALARYGEFLNL